MKDKKALLLLISILIISAIFRLYNFKNLQVWTGDDEILTATIRHIVWDRSPTLLIPNSFLGFGLGPFYYYFLSVFYFLTNFNLVLVQAVTAFFGIATTYFLYLCGKILKNEKVGLIASFLYASSFLMSLFDRRIWPLSLGPLLSALTFLSLAKIINKDYRFFPILAIVAGFVFHTDLSLFVLIIAICFVWVFYRLPIFNKYVVVFFIVLGFFASTFIFAEIRYQGAVSGPVIKSLSRPLRGESITSAKIYSAFGVEDFADVSARTFFTNSSDNIEQHWCHSGCNYPKPPFSPFLQIAIFACFAISFYSLLKNPKRKNLSLVLWIMSGSFVLGTIVYNRIFHANFNQLYFLTIFPVIILIVSPVLYSLGEKRRFLLFLILITYFVFNTYSLINSSVTYPLDRKIELVRESQLTLRDDKFAIDSSSNGDVQGGGWTELYVINKSFPVKSYWYDFSEWIYAAYSLYPGPVQREDPERIVLIQKSGEGLELGQKVISKNSFKDIIIFVIDNSEPKKF